MTGGVAVAGASVVAGPAGTVVVAGGGVVCVVVSPVDVGAGAFVVDVWLEVLPTCIQIRPATTSNAINTNHGVAEPDFLVGSAC